MRRFVSLLMALALLGGMLLPLGVHRAHADAVNLITNPSVETLDASGNPTNWTSNTWGTSDAVLSVNSNAHTGKDALNVTATTRTDGDAKWMPDPVAVTSGQAYTYTDYSKATVATQLDAVYTDASGAVTYNYLGTVQPSTDWQQNTFNLTIPANEVKVSVWHILPTAGSLTTDDFSLTTQATPVQTPPPTGDNLIANPSMETANGTAPAGWQTDNWGANTANFSYVTNDGHTGTNSAKVQITSYTDGDAKWYFNPVAVQPNMQYTFTDYYKSTIASSLVVRFDDGNGNYTYVEPADPVAASDWTQATATFTTPATAKFVTVLHLIAGVGSLQTDDASLVSAASQPAPTAVSITAPSNNATVSGGVQVTLAPNQTTGIKSIQMQLDGQNLGGPITAAPWQFAWNTATTSNGTHTLKAILTPTTGTPITSNAVQVTVNNAAATSNLIANPSFETASQTNTKLPASWNTGGWGTNTAGYTYVSGGHTGAHSAKAQITAFTSGAAYWVPAAASPITGGQMYDFSDWYKANTSSELDATVTMADGSQQYLYLGTAFNSPNSWTKFDIQFTAPAGAVSVQIYHDIYSVGYVQTDDFSLSTFKYQGFKRPLVSITDDDGFTNFYTNGVPVLQKYKLPATAYIISSYLDQPLYMTSAQVKSLYGDNVEVGSHSVDHPDLTTLTATQQDTELKNSQATLQKLLGMNVKDYAAPYGAFNTQVTTDAAKYYQTYRTTLTGYNGKNNFNAMNLYVQNVTSSTTTADVQGWLQEAAATNTWLILVYHEVSTSPVDSVDNTLPADFDAQMAAVKNSGVTAVTMAQAMSEIKTQL